MIKRTFYLKLYQLHFDIILCIFIILILIYSIIITYNININNTNLFYTKIFHIIISLLVMLLSAQLSPKIYYNIALYIYGFFIFLLIFVNFYGKLHHGSSRWINVGYIHFQPSEISKIAIPLAISRLSNDLNIIFYKKILALLLIIILPTLLIIIQPDLGTAILIVYFSLITLFLSKINIFKIVLIIFIKILIFLILMYYLLHTYQINRIIVLLNPNIDPRGRGYHILQSKVAIGSGGLLGKGWLLNTQTQLSFLPEYNTDFIFSVLSKELGFMGVIILFILYAIVILRCLIIMYSTSNNFSYTVSGSILLIFFIYVLINISMVLGIIPIIGVPLPLISYGGSSMITLMINFGILMSIHTNKNIKFY